MTLSFSDDTDEDTDELDDLPESYEAVNETTSEPSEDLLGKTPILSNAQMPACGGAVEFFSQRKAMSLRAGWI